MPRRKPRTPSKKNPPRSVTPPAPTFDAKRDDPWQYVYAKRLAKAAERRTAARLKFERAVADFQDAKAAAERVVLADEPLPPALDQWVRRTTRLAWKAAYDLLAVEKDVLRTELLIGLSVGLIAKDPDGLQPFFDGRMVLKDIGRALARTPLSDQRVKDAQLRWACDRLREGCTPAQVLAAADKPGAPRDARALLKRFSDFKSLESWFRRQGIPQRFLRRTRREGAAP